jgi:predicted transcriptional regulator
MSAKEHVLQVIRALPDDSTMAQIADEIAILAAIERGEEDIAAGRTMTHDELVKQTRHSKPTK